MFISSSVKSTAKVKDSFEQTAISNLSKDKKIDIFSPGDNIKVHVSITEGNTKRIQIFEGLCIAKKTRGLNSSFTVRKISNDIGVERVFPLYSPVVTKVEVVRLGKVRRAKLYYIRALRGKKARIKEKNNFYKRAKVVKTAN